MRVSTLFYILPLKKKVRPECPDEVSIHARAAPVHIDQKHYFVKISHYSKSRQLHNARLAN